MLKEKEKNFSFYRMLGCNCPKTFLNLELYLIFKVANNNGIETISLFCARPDWCCFSNKPT